MSSGRVVRPESEFQFEFVGDWYSVRSVFRDRRLEVATCLGNRVTMEGYDFHAPSLVELQSAKVVVGHDQPEPRAASVEGGGADGIE